MNMMAKNINSLHNNEVLPPREDYAAETKSRAGLSHSYNNTFCWQLAGFKC